MYQEPIHDNTVRTTATSAAEGRMKDSYLKKRKRKYLKNRLDGMGGCGKKKM